MSHSGSVQIGLTRWENHGFTAMGLTLSAGMGFVTGLTVGQLAGSVAGTVVGAAFFAAMYALTVLEVDV